MEDVHRADSDIPIGRATHITRQYGPELRQAAVASRRQTGVAMSKFNVTLIRFKTFEVESEDESFVRNSEDVEAEMNSEGWELAEIQVEPLP